METRSTRLRANNWRCPEMLRIICRDCRNSFSSIAKTSRAQRSIFYEPGISRAMCKWALPSPVRRCVRARRIRQSVSPFPVAAVPGFCPFGKTLHTLTYAVPGRHSEAALHPPKYPWDGAQIFKTPPVSPAGWARADASCIQFSTGVDCSKYSSTSAFSAMSRR